MIQKDLGPYRIRFTDVVAGIAFACLLTLAFVEPLRTSGRLAICAFSCSLPILMAVRLVLEHRTTVPKGLDPIGVAAILAGFITYVGFFLFLAQILLTASFVFLVGSVIALLILMRYGHWLKHVPPQQ
jgi:hypothetical protein